MLTCGLNDLRPRLPFSRLLFQRLCLLTCDLLVMIFEQTALARRLAFTPLAAWSLNGIGTKTAREFCHVIYTI